MAQNKLELTKDLQLYKDAAACMKGAVEESEKRANVDLTLMLYSCKKCSDYILKLQKTDTDNIRQKAISEVKSMLGEQEKILTEKINRLDGQGSNESRNSPSSQSSKSDSSQSYSDNVDDKNTEGCSEPLRKSRKIAIQETIVDKRSITFEDVAGLDEAKQTLREAIVMPLQFPHLFTGFRKPWKRILIYGPPGTGKTRLAQAVSSAIDSTFYCVSSSNLISSWLGESERLIKELFESAQAKDGRSVIFIDEIDSLCRKRISAEQEHTRRVKTEFLKQMEGADSSEKSDKIFLLCATNCPWELDPAFLRRFQKRIYIPLPDRSARLSLMKIHTKENSDVKLSENEWQELADKTEGYSGSDIATLVLGALMEPIRHMQSASHWKYTPGGTLIPCGASVSGAFSARLMDLPPDQVQPRDVTVADFSYSLSIHGKTVAPDDLEQFATFTNQFGQNG